MGKIIKDIFKWAISKFIEYKSDAIITIAVGVIMCVIALLQSIPLFYRIPTILFVILCVLLIFRLVVWAYNNHFTKPSLEIIYNNKCNTETKIFISNDRGYEKCFIFIFGIKNINRNKTIESVSVVINGLNDVSCKLFYTIDAYNIDTKNPIYEVDIHPNLVAYFAVPMVHESYGKGKSIFLTASGKNTIPVQKEFIL